MYTCNYSSNKYYLGSIQLQSDYEIQHKLVTWDSDWQQGRKLCPWKNGRIFNFPCHN